MACVLENKPKQLTNEEEEEACSYAMQLGSTVVLPAVFQAVVNLDVFEIIYKAGPGAELSASEIGSQIPHNNPEAAIMLDRVLGLLITFNSLRCSFTGEQRLYSPASVAKYFVRHQNGPSLRPYMNLTLDPVLMAGWCAYIFLLYPY